MPVGGGNGGLGVGPSVEIRREKGGGLGMQTPGPMVGSFGEQQDVGMMGMAYGGNGVDAMGDVGREGEPIVVSVGLAQRMRKGRRVSSSDGDSDLEEDEEEGEGVIYPLEHFTLDIFVFNQSSRTRRFEVSYPDPRRRRRVFKGEEYGFGFDERKAAVSAEPGVIPLDNRVRVGYDAFGSLAIFTYSLLATARCVLRRANPCAWNL